MTLNPTIIRNVLRYISGALVAKGLIGADTGTALAVDPVIIETVTVAAGVMLGSVTEVIYAIAKKMGWRT
ncbi:hypothetical protein [Paenirhodobacter sp.]|uniref:hypothetical protein n=1 Tax=Paenirhodobacter sp. TaxID=1965326 RepID=UPI003B3D88FA